MDQSRPGPSLTQACNHKPPVSLIGSMVIGHPWLLNSAEIRAVNTPWDPSPSQHLIETRTILNRHPPSFAEPPPRAVTPPCRCSLRRCQIVRQPGMSLMLHLRPLLQEGHPHLQVPSPLPDRGQCKKPLLPLSSAGCRNTSRTPGATGYGVPARATKRKRPAEGRRWSRTASHWCCRGLPSVRR